MGREAHRSGISTFWRGWRYCWVTEETQRRWRTESCGEEEEEEGSTEETGSWETSCTPRQDCRPHSCWRGPVGRRVDGLCRRFVTAVTSESWAFVPYPSLPLPSCTYLVAHPILMSFQLLNWVFRSKNVHWIQYWCVNMFSGVYEIIEVFFRVLFPTVIVPAVPHYISALAVYLIVS